MLYLPKNRAQCSTVRPASSLNETVIKYVEMFLAFTVYVPLFQLVISCCEHEVIGIIFLVTMVLTFALLLIVCYVSD